MKNMLLISLLISGQGLTADLIFKSGFEASALVSGTATGVNNTGLSLQLTVNATTETLAINANGVFVFNTEVAIGDSWSVQMTALPNNPAQQNCHATNTSGSMTAGGAATLQITCNISPWNWDQMDWDEGGWN